MINKILIAQPQQAGSNPQYISISNRYSVSIDFMPFFSIEPIGLREFRGQGINILDFSAIVFTAKASIDAFFKICQQLRIKIPDSQKYFCTTEGVAFYLQKHIIYRKRKIFYGDGTFGSIIKLATLDKHKNEKFLIVSPDHHNPELLKLFEQSKLKYSTSIMSKFVDADLKGLNISNYQIIAFYNAIDVRSLKSNFSDYKQADTKFIAFGAGTKKAMEEAKLKVAISGPTKEIPSMGNAIEQLLKDPNFKQEPIKPEIITTAVNNPTKSTDKKAVTKKTVAVKKSATKKTIVKKATTKKATKKKVVAKKPIIAKKSATKKTIVKKVTTKKVTNKKDVTKKPTIAKKSATKKTIVKKATTKKVTNKKDVTKKPTIAKKSATKKTIVKKTTTKKVTNKKIVTKKPVAVKKVAKKVVIKKGGIAIKKKKGAKK